MVALIACASPRRLPFAAASGITEADARRVIELRLAQPQEATRRHGPQM
jgi:hypothetical protein